VVGENYFRSIQELPKMGTMEILPVEDKETKRAILGVVAIAILRLMR